MQDYAAFLKSKALTSKNAGFSPVFMPSFLYGFQSALCSWSIERGLAAVFADCGL